MEKIYNIQSVSQLNDLLNQQKAKHPLITVVDFTKMEEFTPSVKKFSTSLYCVMLKNQCHGTLKYGRQNYDFQEGTMVFIGPEQVIGIDEDDALKPKSSPTMGWGLFFHPDLIRGTSLSAKMKDYTFFSFETNEALHLSDLEKQTVTDCVIKIQTELEHNIDKHSQTLIVSNIELLLNYCTRYYDRQFITRTTKNRDILAKFESVINTYFNTNRIQTKGSPTVKYCAELLNLSPNYLSDLLKKETGKNAIEHIHYQLVEEAKNRLLISTNSVSEIAFELGFEYPQYFSKMFKKQTGLTPSEYRNLN